ncbi:MAG: UDP-N-acetylglucosamine 4,6-dehydratase family protein [Candidatus Micrarchaeota archaeon]
MYEKFVKGKKILVTGGTGSFGSKIVSRLTKLSPEKIVIFSRDENKQYHMRNQYPEIENLQFEIGDVRDHHRLKEVMKGINVVFHAAAMKHVPQSEYFPFEAVKTNVIGAKNVVEAAIEAGVEKALCVSTDKAVKPVNVMGMSKAIQEKIFIAANGRSDTQFMCVRYGNVINSRGSAVPFFKELILEKKPIPITDERMTRFLLSIDEGIDLVLEAVTKGKNGEIFVKKMPACKITQLAQVMGKEIGKKENYPTKIIGIRPGEKIHEVLVSEEEMARAEETENHFIIHKYENAASLPPKKNIQEYASNNTHMMSDEEIRDRLTELGIFE